jgi:hypothetical protein
VGRITNLTGVPSYVRVALSLPDSDDGAVPVTVGMSVHLQAGETLYARALHGSAYLQADDELTMVATPPLFLLTNQGGQYGRLRVDPDQTSFWEGKQYRTFREINIASGATLALRVNVAVNTVLYDVSLTLDAGAVRLRTVEGGTEGGTFSEALPIIRKNTMTDCPVIAAQNAIAAGGTLTGGVDIDVIRLVAANATAQQSSVGSKAFDQRGVAPGIYYWLLTNIGQSAATGVFSSFWEERG